MYRVGRRMQQLAKEYPDYLFISPIHMFGHLYYTVSYEVGLKWRLEILDLCDELWILQDDGESKGVAAEREYALKNKIPIVTFDNPR